MKKGKEKSIQVFNRDVKNTGQYLYTDLEKYSANIATKKQSEELIKIVLKYSKLNRTILDVGCGDGIFTFELLEETNPKKIVGFDSAQTAVKVAANRINPKDKKKISFKIGDVYDAFKLFPKKSFDIIVVRGVLHHLYNPQKAIKSLSTLSDKIIILEPNGYNPILKIIEKASPYHRQHEERSYWPPTINKWFTDLQFEVKEQSFFGIVPYFCPKPVAQVLKFIEPGMEKIPVIYKFYCGTNLIYYEKKIK